MRQARGGRVMHAPPHNGPGKKKKKKKRRRRRARAPLFFPFFRWLTTPAHTNPHSHTHPTHTSWATPHPARPPRPSRSRWRRRRCVMWEGSDGERKRERARRPAAGRACVCPPSPSRQGDGARPLARPDCPRVGWAGRLGCLARPVDCVPGRGSPATCPSGGLPLPLTRRPIAPPPCRSLCFFSHSHRALALPFIPTRLSSRRRLPTTLPPRRLWCVRGGERWPERERKKKSKRAPCCGTSPP